MGVIISSEVKKIEVRFFIRTKVSKRWVKIPAKQLDFVGIFSMLSIQPDDVFDALDAFEFFHQQRKRGRVGDVDGECALKKTVDRIYVDRTE